MAPRLAALILFAALAAACAPKSTAPIVAPGLTLQKAWSRPAPAGGVGGGFGELVNLAAEPATLSAITSPAAEKVELHLNQVTDGVYSMKPYPHGVIVPAGGRITLSPDGFHAMLIGLTAKTEKTRTIPATLTFTQGGRTWTYDFAFEVRSTAPKRGAP